MDGDAMGGNGSGDGNGTTTTTGIKQQYRDSDEADDNEEDNVGDAVADEQRNGSIDRSIRIGRNITDNSLQGIDSLLQISKSHDFSGGGGGSSNNNKQQESMVGGGGNKSSTAANKKKNKFDVKTSSKPKMIHTQKTNIAAEDGKRKVKTLITRTSSGGVETNEPTTTPRAASSSRRSRAAKPSIVAEPTLVKQEDFAMQGLTDTEIFLELSRKNLKYSPDVVNDLEEILRSPIKSKDIAPTEEYITSDLVDPAYLHSGQLQQQEQQQQHQRNSRPQRSSMRRPAATPSPTKQSPPKNKRAKLSMPSTSTKTKTTTVSRAAAAASAAAADAALDHHHHHHNDDDDDDDDEDNADESYDDDSDRFKHKQLDIKQEQDDQIEFSPKYTCSMCSAVFRDRAQLLVHVPIHI